MANEYVHGIRVVKGAEGARIVLTPNQSVVGIVGTAPKSRALSIETPIAFHKESEALEAIFPLGSTGDRGSLFQSVKAIYAQGSGSIVIIRAKSESTADIIAAISRFPEAEALTGLKPKILCAPGHTGNLPKSPSTTPSSSPSTPAALAPRTPTSSRSPANPSPTTED